MPVRQVGVNITCLFGILFAVAVSGGVAVAQCPQVDLGSQLPIATSGNTSGSGSYSPATGTCPGGSAPEASYEWTAPYAGSFVFDTAGSGFDTVLHIRNATCSGAQLACDDDSGPGTTSQLTLALAAQQTVVVFVDGYNTASGAFALGIVDAAGTPTPELTSTPQVGTPTPTPTPTSTPTTGPPAAVVLQVGDALVIVPGDLRIDIPILLSNNVAVRGLQFTLRDVPEQVSLSTAPECTTTARTAGFSCACNQTADGLIRCAILSTSTAVLAPGTGAIATVWVDDTAPSCTHGGTIQLVIGGTAIADVNNQPVAHSAVDGTIRCGCDCDINCNGECDIFDALTCVDVALERDPVRCDDGDLNADGDTDIFDCLLIVDSILGRRPECP